MKFEHENLTNFMDFISKFSLKIAISFLCLQATQRKLDFSQEGGYFLFEL